MSDEDQSSLLLREIFLAGFLSGLPAANVAWAAARLASTMSDVRVQAGDFVYRKGDPSDEHFFILEGEVRLESADDPAWLFGPHSLIGTMDLMLERPRSRDARATRNSHLLRMPAQDWLDMLEDNFELTRSAVQGLAVGVDELRVALGDLDVDVSMPWVKPAALNVPPGKLGLLDRIVLLRGVPILAEADVQALTNLAILAQDVTLESGEALLERGTSNDSMFVVVRGEVSASRADARRREMFGPGKLVFGASAVAPENLAHDALAAGPVYALRITREDYFDVMEEHFALARSSMKVVALEREVLINEQARRNGGGEARL